MVVPLHAYNYCGEVDHISMDCLVLIEGLQCGHCGQKGHLEIVYLFKFPECKAYAKTQASFIAPLPTLPQPWQIVPTTPSLNPTLDLGAAPSNPSARGPS